MYFCKLRKLFSAPVFVLLFLQMSLAFALDEWSGPAFVLSFLLWGFWIVFCLFSKQFLIAIFSLFFVCGSLALFIFLYRPGVTSYIQKKPVYSGYIKQQNILSHGRTRFTAVVQEVGNIHIKLPEPCWIAEGSAVRFSARIRPALGFSNPGVFDYQKYLSRQNISAQAYIEHCDELEVVESVEKSFTEVWRQNLYQQLPQKYRGLWWALLTGEKSLGPDERLVIQKAGVSHLFVISGTHFGLMMLCVYFLITGVLRMAPQLFLFCARQRIAAFVTLCFVCFYMVMIGFHPSVFRAGLMGSVYLLGMILGKRHHHLNALCVAALIELFLFPLDVFLVSFQLSYFCVLVLLLIVPPVISFVGASKKTVVFVATNFILQVVLLPLIAFHFQEITFGGFVNNLWALPFFSFVMIPFVFFCWVLSVFGISVKMILESFGNVGLDLFFGVAEVSASYFKTLHQPLAWAVSGFEILVILFFVIFVARIPLRRYAFVLVIALLGYHLWQGHEKQNFKVKISQIDVGQGDAVLVQTPQKNLLVDTGGHYYFDLAERVLIPHFRHVGVKSLDAVVITHADWDHYGALFGLLEKIPVAEVWLPAATFHDATFVALLNQLKWHGIPICYFAQDQEIDWGQGITWHVLTHDVVAYNDNDKSLILQLRFPGGRALFTGDISSRIERRLVSKYGKELQSDYLKVSHHGSRSSSDELFLQTVNPKVVGIGVGRHSRFGHPHQEVLERFEKMGVELRRTDEMGWSQIKW